MAPRKKQGTDNAPPTLYLIDGSSYLYRAFHALPPLMSADGRPTGAVYGVVNMLNKFLDETQPSHIAVLFDARGKTFRDELYAEYKAQRPSMPDDLRAQIEPLHETVRALGLPIIQVPGVEADDVIGTLCAEASAAGWRTVVSTIDKDMAQLVSDQVTLVNTMFDTRLDRDGVIAKFGVQPEQIVDYLALVGDTSDNIPGVPGVGQKSAAGLLATFESLDGIYANLERLGDAKVRGAKRIGEKLTEHEADARLSRQLATIRCDLDLDVSATGLAREAPDNATLRQLYTRLEFGTLLRQLSHDAPGTGTDAGEVTAADDAANVQLVTDTADLSALVEKLGGQTRVALAVHTVRPEEQDASRLVALSLAYDEGREVAYLATSHHYAGVPAQLDADAMIDALRPLLEGR
ncbi:MAG: 5'-3' exonuclease H3TH domain-containing protein, partial [Pseudomonadota bacterium]